MPTLAVSVVIISLHNKQLNYALGGPSSEKTREKGPQGSNGSNEEEEVEI